VLLHMLDAGQINLEAPLADYEAINAELADFSPELKAKKQIVAINKMDLPEAEQKLETVRAARPDLEVMGVSALTGQGLTELKWALFKQVRADSATDGDDD